MGLSILFPVLLSVILTLIIVLVIRYYDKKSSTYGKICDKIKGFSQNCLDVLEAKYKDKSEKMDEQSVDLELKFAKGEGLIRELKKFENELKSLEYAKNEISEYSPRLKSMESRIENLNKALENISTKEEYLQSVSVELEGFQEKIDIFKTNLKSFNDRVDNLENSFSRKNERALNDIEQRVLSNFEAEIQNAFSELNTHRKALEDFYSEIDVRLNEERKRLSESLLNINEKKEEIHSSFDAKINDFSTKVSQDLNHLYEEHQNRLTSFEKAFRENESRIVNIIRDEGTKKIQDINVCFDSSWNDTKVKLQHYENNIVESINKHYENGKIDVEKILQELRTVEIRVSKSMLELSDLDSKVQQKSDSFELCLEESIKNKIDKFYDGLHEIESDIESMQTTIFSSLKNKYEKFDFVIMSELKKLGLRIGEKVELKWKELSEMENKVSELKEAMFSVENDVKETVSKLNEMSQDLKDNLYQRIDTVSADVNEKIKDMSLSYEDKRKTLINAMKNSLDSLDSDSREKVFNLRNQIQEIYSAVKSRLTTAENEIQRKTDTINRKFDQKIELIDEQIRQREDRANTLIMEKMLGYFKDADEKSKEFASNLQEYYEDIFKLKNDFRKKCEGLTSWFAEKVKVFAGENDIVGRKYREELKMLEADSLNLRDKIQAENNQYIQSLNNQFKQIEDKLPIINEKIRLNSENISRITENSIADMQKTVSSEIFNLNQKIAAQSATMDEKLLQKMRDVNEVISVIQSMISQYDSKLNDFDSQKTRIFESLENDINTLKISYKEKGDELIKSSEKNVESIKESIHLLKEKADSINEDLVLTVDNKILRSKKDFERIYSGIQESGKKELEGLINAKSAFMTELENRIATLSNNSKASLIKILKIAQKNINEVRDNAGKDISERCRELEEGAIASLSSYREEIEAVKASLDELGNHVGPEVLEKIRASENALETRLSEMNEKCDEFLEEIESNFSEKRSEELKGYTESIQALKNEMKEAGELLRVRIDEELSVAREEASRDFDIEIEKKLSAYESSLSTRYEELTRKLQEDFKNNRERITAIENANNERFDAVISGYDEKSQAYYREYTQKLASYTDRFVALEERIEGIGEDISRAISSQEVRVNDYAAKLSNEYEELSLSLSGELEKLSKEVTAELKGLESGIECSEETLVELNAKYRKLGEGLAESDEALKNYRRELTASKAELENAYREQFNAYNEELSNRFVNIHDEITERIEHGIVDAVKEFKDNIFNRSEECFQKVVELVHQRIDAIQRAEGDCERDLKIRIDSYGEEIKNMQLHCAELEMQYENAVRDGLRQADKMIEAKLSDVSSYIAKEKSAIAASFQNQLDTNETQLNSLVNKAKEYQKSYEDLALKMSQLESDITGKVNIYLEQVVADFDAPIADARRELAQILTRVDGLKDAIDTKTRLMADEILAKLKEKTESIADVTEKRSAEWESQMEKLFERVETHLTSCKTTVEMQTEKLQKLEASYQAQLSRKLGETDQALENELNNLHKAFLNASEKLSKETAILCRDYEERGRDLFASTQDTMAEMENKIAGLDSRIESIDSEIGGKLEKQFVSVQEKMDAFTARQEDLYVMRVEELRKQFKEELDAAQIMCVSKLTEMQAGIDGKTQSIYLKLNKIYDDFSVDAMKFDNENRERYRGLLEKMEEAAEKVDTLKEELSLGMEERIKREFKIADELFIDKAQDMRENIQRMEVESKKQLDDYYKELMRVQDALDVIENDYAEMMQNKFASLDVQASEYLTQIKTALTESVTLINSKMSELSDKMKTVETSYTEKAEFMLFNQEQKWKEVEDKYSDFDEHVDAVYRRLPEAAKEMDEVVAIGKAKLEDAFYFQIEEQKRHFKEAEMQLDKKALSLNKKMQEMQRSIRDIDNRFAAEYLERSAVLDERIASIEFEISKFERNIMLVQKTGEMKDELEKEIAGLKNTVADVKADKNKMEALGQRMAELEESASERYEKLFAQSQSYEDLNLRIKDLQQEIESVEEKTQDLREMRLATQQLDAKFIVLERQFGRIDSMIGKIETSESIAKDYYQKLNEMRLNVTQLRQMMSTMESQWQEMEVKRKVYGEKIEHFESEADLILNSQSQINAVMTKFKQMDLLVEDLESRTDAVRHLQDWLIRAETRMENMKTDLQRVLPEEKPVVVEASDNLGESIRELYRQGMSAADIAKIVGTSLEEVEFAVELEEVLSSKR